MQKKNRTSFRSSSRALALEPRLLFDGAGAVAAVDHFDTAGEHQAETQPQAAQPAADARPSEVAEKPANTGALVIVDSRVPDYQSLIDQLPADATVRVVGADESGLDVVGAELAKGQFEAVHILSHGTPGSFALGTDTLNNDSLASHSAALSAWAAQLTAGADILLYGCDIAQGEQSQAFINEVARLTSADIAASTNATGAAAKGGDWVLESATGSIEAGVFSFIGYGELLDDSGPTVESIVRQTPTAETTNATSVKFLVTFSESVSGVSADSFVIAPGSISGATVQLVTEVKDSSGKQYEVTIGNLNGAGSLNIDIAANNAIKNGNSLGMTDLTSSSGRDDSYTIDTLINKAVIQGIGTGSVSGQNILTSTAGGYLLNGIADRGDIVRIYIDGALVGTTTAHATTGAWSLTTSATALSVGNHTLVVRSSDAAGNLINSDAYTLTVDNAVPALDSSASKVDDRIIELKFDRDLTAGTATSDSSGLGFTVKVNGSASVDTRVIRADVVGSVVRLTLAKDVASTDTVTVSYDSSVAGSAAIKSAAGNVVSTILETTLATNVTKVSDSAPVVNSLGNPTWYSKGDPAVAVFDSTSLTLTDTDDSYLESAVVTIETNRTAGDALAINNAASGTLASGIAWNYDSVTGKLALSGHASLSDYKAALNLVCFSATGGISAVSANVDRAISLTVNDGQKNSTEVVRTMRVLGSAFSTGETTAAYVVQTNATSTGLQVINLVTGTVTKEMNLTGISSSSNAMAFSPVDGHLYVSDNTNYKILRINADGTVTDMSAKYRTDGVNNSWQPENSVISGDIDANGIMYLNDNNSAKVIYRFDTNPASANYGKWLEPLTLKISGTEIAPRWTDMAVSPINEGGKYYIYAVGGDATASTTIANGSYLYKIDPSDGTVVKIGAIKLADTDGNRTTTNPNGGSSGYPMQYFDQNGYFYFTAGNTSGGQVSIYRVDTTAASTDGKTTAVELKFAASTFPTTGDAARIVTIKLDYGDAPDTYYTTLEKDGARHSQVGNKVWLGNNVNDEKVASPDVNADSDQHDDGVDIAGSGILRRGVDTYSIDVKIHGGSVGDVLIGWVDFDGNGSFDQREAASVTLTQEMVNAGKATLTWNGIAAITAANSGSAAFDTYARFRIVGKDDVTGTFKVLASDGKGAGTGGGAATRDARSYGALLSGEVEDYKITIQDVDITRPDVSTVVVTGGNGPRSTPVGEVTVKFSESVKDVDVSDFKLYRKDANDQWQEVTLPGNTPVTGGGDTWKIDLSKVTNPTGEYKLEIPGNTLGIKDFGNNNLNQGGEVIFLIDTTAPVIDLDASSPSRDWSATSTNGAAVSLDNNAAPATVTEEGAVPGTGEITRIDIAISGLRDGDDEKLIFGSTTLKAGGEVPGSNVTVGGHTVSITYDATKGAFTITKPGGNFTSAEASAIVADIQYRNAADSLSTSGERSFSFTATDKAGVVATAAVARVNVTGDGTNGPQTPTVDPKVSNTPTPVVTGGAVVPPASGSTLVVTIDGETYTWTSGTDTPGTPNSNGITYHDGNDPDSAKRYTWSVQVRNPLDDKTYPVTATVTPSGGASVTDITTNELVIDTTPPDVPTVVSQVTNNHTPTITGTANVREGETLSVTVNGKTYTEGDGKLVRTNNTWTLTIPSADQIPDGSYPVEAKVIDAAGNVSQDITTNELVIDSVPPVLDLDPSDIGTVNHKARSVNGALVSLDDNGDAATLVEGSDQIAKIEIAVSGVVDTGGWESIKIGNEVNLWYLGTGGTQSTNGAVAGGVTGLNIVRDSSNKFTITKADGSTLTQAQAQAIIRDFQYQNSKGAASTMGDRTFTFTATDKAGNVSNAAVSTVTVAGPLAVSSITVNEASPYAVFTVTATPGDVLTGLTLTGDTTSGKATGGGVDFGSSGSDGKVNLEISLDNGVTWTSYGSGNITVPTGGASDGKVLVRTSITNDTTYEGSETFTLTVTPQTGANATGTATITDDGTGTIWVPKDPNNPVGELIPNPSDPRDPSYIIPDDDRLVTVDSPTVNEKSPHIVYEVTGVPGQKVEIKIADSGTAAPGGDYVPTIEVSTDDGNTWTSYTGGAVELPLGGEILVRVPLIDDNLPETPETVELTVTPVGGQPGKGTATIVDDGTGTVFDSKGQPTPNDPKDPYYTTPGNLPYIPRDNDHVPTANPDTGESRDGRPITVDVRGNDTDPDTDPLTVTEINGQPFPPSGVIELPEGSVNRELDGSLTFTPKPGSQGAVVIEYTVEDPHGNKSTSQWTVTVVPEAPPQQPGGSGETPANNGDDITKRPADDLILGEQVKDPSVFFDGSMSDGVRRMQIPLHPVLYVDIEVSRAQQERALDDTRAFSNPHVVNTDNRLAPSIGAGLGQDPNLFVSHAIRDSQSVASFLRSTVEGRYSRLSLGSDGYLASPGLFSQPATEISELLKEQRKKLKKAAGEASVAVAENGQGDAPATQPQIARAAGQPDRAAAPASGGVAAPSFNEQLRSGAARLPMAARKV